MAKRVMTKEDKEWQARIDAETLAEAEKIQSNKKRLRAAAKHCDKVAKEAVKLKKNITKRATKKKVGKKK